MKFVDLAVTTDAGCHLFLFAGYNYAWLGPAFSSNLFFSFLFLVTCRTCISRRMAAAMFDGFSFKSEFSGVVVSELIYFTLSRSQ